MNNKMFIWIPKTSGTSLYRAMSEKDPTFLKCLDVKKIPNGTHGHVKINCVYSEQELENFYIFTIVRNPYSRTVSLYEYLKKLNIIDKITFLDFTNKIKSVPPIGPYNRIGLSQCNPQSDWLFGIKKVQIFYFENLSPLYDELGLKKQYVLNKSVSGDYREYYCTKSKINVDNFYSIDFENFSYKTEI